MKLTLVTTAVVTALAAPAWAKRPTERRLHTEQVDASSFLWNDWNKFQENYHPNYVGDDDPKTAWTEGVASSGEGEWIRIRVTELEGTSKVRLKVRNGYQKSPGLFTANARAKGVTIKLLPGGATRTVTLADQRGWQDLVVDQPAGPLEAIEILATSVYPGTKYTDLCISDVQVFATSTARENPAFEKGKRAKLLAWKGDRVKAAKLFGKAAGKALPLHPAYHVEQTDANRIDLWDACMPTTQDTENKMAVVHWRCHTRKTLELAANDPEFARRWGKLLPVAQQAAAQGLKGFVAAKLAPTDKRPLPAVDGLTVPELYQGYEGGYGYGGFELPVLGSLASLRGEDLRPLEIKSAVTVEDALATRAPGCNKTPGRTYSWLHRAKLAGERDGRDVLRAMTIVQCGKIEVRDGTAEAAQFQVLVYGDDGSLALVAGPGYVAGYEWATEGGRLVLAGGRRILAEGSRDVLTAGSAAASAAAKK